MQCPVDGTTLLMSERSGIEIDYCPKCRGIWLDRGELDKLIAREAEASGPYADFDADASVLSKPKNDQPLRPPAEPERRASYLGDADDYGDDDRRFDDSRYDKRRRRGSFLEDLFDIFD